MADEPQNPFVDPTAPQAPLGPVCPHCLETPIRIQSTNGLQMGPLQVVVIFCANVQCRVVLAVEVVAVQQQQRIVDPSGRNFRGSA